MTFDPIWEEIHRAREWGKYPPEELIRFIARNYYSRPDRQAVRLLDLGCGTGSGVWYMAREGFDAVGIDISPSAIRRLEQRLRQENLSAQLYVGDVVTSLPRLFAPESFDAVADITCLYSIPSSEAKRAVAEVWRMLKPNGRFFSMVFDVETWGFGLGREVEPNAFTDIPEGPLKERGFARFYRREDIEEFCGPFSVLTVESVTRTMDDGRKIVKHWVIECGKTAAR